MWDAGTDKLKPSLSTIIGVHSQEAKIKIRPGALSKSFSMGCSCSCALLSINRFRYLCMTFMCTKNKLHRESEGRGKTDEESPEGLQKQG